MDIVWIPDAGHLCWIDEPTRVVQEIERFLTRDAQPAPAKSS